MKVIIVGAGGHGYVVADILLRARDAGAPVQPVGFVDDCAELKGAHVLGLPVLADFESLLHLEHDGAIVAVGDNRTRQRLFARLEGARETFVEARHPSATIAPDVFVGEGSMICAHAVVNPATEIGQDTILNTACTVDHHSRIGAHVHIAPGAHLGGAVTVGDGALVGIGAIVLPGVRIGARAVVGGGAVVIDDVPEGATVVGNPARQLMRV